jgi:predicted RNA-binding protein
VEALYRRAGPRTQELFIRIQPANCYGSGLSREWEGSVGGGRTQNRGNHGRENFAAQNVQVLAQEMTTLTDTDLMSGCQRCIGRSKDVVCHEQSIFASWSRRDALTRHQYAMNAAVPLFRRSRSVCLKEHLLPTASFWLLDERLQLYISHQVCALVLLPCAALRPLCRTRI